MTSLSIFLVEQSEKIEEEQKQTLIPKDLELTADRVKLHTFPTYVPPNVKDDMVRQCCRGDTLIFLFFFVFFFFFFFLFDIFWF